MLRRLLVFIATFLAESKRYNSVKHFFRTLFVDSRNPLKKYFDLLMIFVVVSSVLLLIVEVNHTLDPWLVFFNYTIVTIVFLIEYILRLWVHNDLHKIIIDEYDKSRFISRKMALIPLFWKLFLSKFEYVSSPSAIIDLLAILPSYRPLRVLRVFVLFRVIKLLRYTKSIQGFVNVLSAKKFELLTLLIFLAFIVFVSSVLLYVFEGSGENEKIETFFDAIYWALVTISTVGYGDVTPITDAGKAISMLVIVAGLGILSFATSIIVSAFNERLDELKEERIFRETESLDRFYLVCGYSSMSQIIAYRLKSRGFKIVVLDRDHLRVEQARKDGHVAIFGDATKLSLYHEMNLSKVNRIIAALTLTKDDVQNISITLTLRSISQNIDIYSLAQTDSLVRKLYLAGAKKVIYGHESIGNMAHIFVSHPIAFDAVSYIVEGESHASLHELTLFEHDKTVGKRLDEIDFFALKLILLGVTRDGHFVFNPNKDFIFLENDTLIVVGHMHHVNHLRDIVLSRKGS